MCFGLDELKPKTLRPDPTSLDSEGGLDSDGADPFKVSTGDDSSSDAADRTTASFLRARPHAEALRFTPGLAVRVSMRLPLPSRCALIGF